MWHWNIVSGELVWSDRCKALFGVPPDTMMSYERFLQALHPEDRERTAAAVKRALDHRVAYDIEYRCLRPDGSVHWLAAKGLGYYDASGKAERMEGVVLDITERIRDSAELHARYDELTRFNQVAVGRELRMIELKREVNELCGRLGEPVRHRIVQSLPAVPAIPETPL